MAQLQDEIHHAVSDADFHIYYIPGNPGLISYYTVFLSSLSQHLNQPSSPNRVSVYGKSLSGFELVKSNSSLGDDHGGELVDLQGQIAAVETSLHAYCAQVKQSRQALLEVTEARRAQVILMGHSVGAYILMELVRRHRAAQKKGSLPFDIAAGVLLFPTIMDIAQSPNGKQLGWLLNMHSTPAMLGNAVKGLTWLLPGPSFRWVVQTVTRMPEDAAQVTEAFLRSDKGVNQALYLARTELEKITLDKWDDDIWEASKTKEHTSLFFYFGTDDQWVANHTRDELIRTRGQGEGVKMEVDALSIPHGFCIRHSELVAEKVYEFVDEMIRSR